MKNSAQHQTVFSIRGLAPWMGLSALVLIVDFLTKRYFESQFFPGEVRPVTSFFNLVLAHNRGAAFSFLAGHDGWQLYFFSLIAIVAAILCVYFIGKHSTQRLFCLALSLIMAGAVGNLIDRILYGYVVDFLDFYLGHWHWPAFNVADIAIVCGAGLLILESFLEEKLNSKH